MGKKVDKIKDKIKEEFEEEVIAELVQARISASIDRPILLLHLDRAIEEFVKNKCLSITYLAWLLGSIQGYYRGASSDVGDDLERVFRIGMAKIAVKKLWED